MLKVSELLLIYEESYMTKSNNTTNANKIPAVKKDNRINFGVFGFIKNSF